MNKPEEKVEKAENVELTEEQLKEASGGVAPCACKYCGAYDAQHLPWCPYHSKTGLYL